MNYLLVEKIKTLCKENNTSIFKLEQALKFGNGTIARWDNWRPSVDRVKAVADYFGVTIDALLSDHKEG